MHFKKRTMRSPKPAEWAQRLHHACAVRPSTARAAAQRYHPHLAGRKRCLAEFAELRINLAPCVKEFFRRHILNLNCRRQPILSNSDMPRTQLRLNSLMLKRIESVRRQQRLQCLRLLFAAIAVRQKAIEKAPRAVTSAGHVM